MSYILGIEPEDFKKLQNISKDDTIGEVEKTRQLHTTIASLKNKPRAASQTIFNVANTMMGSALLVMQIHFYEAGLITSIIAAAIVAYLSFKTANLCILHSLPEEIDYPEAINRILGKKYEVFYNIISIILLFLVGVIHFILQAHTLYAILKNIFPGSGDWPPTNVVDWQNFSLQYVGIIVFVICFIIFLWEDLSIVLKINDKGVYMIMIFCVYTLYLGIYGLINYDISFVPTGNPGKMKEGLELILFSFNIETLIGIFGLAFFIHNVVNGIMKSNPQNEEKNTKDLRWAYIIVFILYCILGGFGMLAVSYLYHEMYADFGGKLPETIMDLLVKSNPGMDLPQRILGIISLVLVFTQLTTVLPILCFFTRRMFFNLFYLPGHTLPKWQFHLFNLVFNVGCLIIQIFAFDPSKVISVTGALGGFFLGYSIPIYLHLKCLYFIKNKKSITEKILNLDDDEAGNPKETLVLTDKTPSNRISNSSDKNSEKASVSNQKIIEDIFCVDHQKYYAKNKILVISYYTVLLLIGTAILVLQFKKLFFG